MANEYNIKRTAFANITYPGHASATASTATGVYIPAGAIVTGIRCLNVDGLTDLSVASNATMTPYVGAIAIGSNNNVVSAKVVSSIAKLMTIAATADGVYLSTGGVLAFSFGSTHTDATGMTADFDVYVDYIYCNERD